MSATTKNLKPKPFDPNTPFEVTVSGADAAGNRVVAHGTWTPNGQEDMLRAEMAAAVVLARKAGLARISDGYTRRNGPPVGLPSIGLEMSTPSVEDDSVTLDAVRPSS